MIDLDADAIALADKVRSYRHLLPPVPADLVARMEGRAAPPTTDTADAQAEPALHPWRALDAAAAHDRALGCLLGLAVGEALGAAARGQPRGSFDAIDGPLVKGAASSAAGSATAMALCLAASLLARGDVDLDDFMARLQACTDEPGHAELGWQTQAAVARYAMDGNPAAGDRDPMAAGSGSLARLAPLAIYATRDADAAEALAARQSRATHGTLECVDACRLFALQLVDALSGAGKELALRQRVMMLCPQLLFLCAGEFEDRKVDELESTGYVVRTLEAALWAVWTTDDFRGAVLAAANLGGPGAERIAAVTGQLAGALYGAAQIPPEWLEMLAGRKPIEILASELVEASTAKRAAE